MLIQVTSSFLGCSSERENMATAGAGRLEEGPPSCAAPGAGGPPPVCPQSCDRSTGLGCMPGTSSGSAFWRWTLCLCLLSLFSRQIISDSVQPCGQQHIRPPCPHHLPKFAQVHVHWIGDAIQPSHPLLPLPTLDRKEIQPVHPKENQPWISIGKTDAEAEAPLLWPPDAKNWLIGKDPDAGKDWGQEEKGAAEDVLCLVEDDGLGNHESPPLISRGLMGE